MSRRVIMIGTRKGSNFPEGTFADGRPIKEWTRRLQLGNDVNMVTADLTNFMALIKIPSTANAWWVDQNGDPIDGDEFWTKIKSNAGDLRFTLEDGVTEVPGYSFGLVMNNEVWIFYRHAGTFSFSSQNKPYIYWGNPNATAYAPGDSMGRDAVFQDYKGFWIFQDLPSSGTLTDLTGNGFNGSIRSGIVDSDHINAKIGKGYNLDAGNLDGVYIGPNFINQTLTLSTWFRADALNQDRAIMGEFRSNFWASYEEGLRLYNSTIVATSQSAGSGQKLFAAIPDDVNFHHIACVIRTANGKLFVNGALQSSGALNNGYTYNFGFGYAAESGDREINGAFDVSGAYYGEKPDAMVNAEYNNQDDALLFWQPLKLETN